MEDDIVADVLRRSIGTVLRQDITAVPMDSRLYEDLNLDSATVLQVLMGVESDLGIDLDPEELMPEHFATLGSLAAYLRTCR